MYKKITRKTFLILFFTLPLFSDIGMQEGVYDAAEEMMKFDTKMNQLIAEHNQLDEEDKREFEKTRIEDFEETENGYILKKNISDGNGTKVGVSLKNGMLSISIQTTEKEVLLIGNERSYETTMNSSTSSLYLPQDADEKSMKHEYKEGVLKVTFLKK